MRKNKVLLRWPPTHGPRPRAPAQAAAGWRIACH